MKKASYISFFEMIILILFFVLNIFIFGITNIYVFVGILAAFTVFSFFMLGYEKNFYRNKKDIMFTLLICIFVYFLLTYIFGLITGFVKNGYSLKFVNIIKNIFPYILLILTREFFRYIYFNKAKNSKILMVVGIIMFVLIDINLKLHVYDISKTLGLTKMICLVFFPSIAKNIFLSYLTVKVGYENAIIYSMIMELKQFLLPIFPDFGEYINTIIEVCFPLYLTYNVSEKFKFNEKRRISSSRYRQHNLIFYVIVTIMLLVIVMLTSGYFKYYALTIGSGSMMPTINKGDVVIVKTLKQNELKEIKKNDVLVYNHDRKIIVHRIIEIKELGGKEYYLTKGDNNATKDAYLVDKEDVIGIVSFRIKYIGYPTVSLNEKIAGE